MKSTWKRVFATLLTIAMLASLLVVPAAAAETPVVWTDATKDNEDVKAIFTTSGSQKTGAGNTYLGVEYSKGLKIESSGQLDVAVPKAGGTLLVVAGKGSADVGYLAPNSTELQKLTVTASTYEGDKAYVGSMEVTEGTWTLKKGTGSDWLIYVSFTPNPSGPSIAVTPATAEVEVGKTTTLTATTENAEGAAVGWTSSNDSVATVENGVVTGVTASEDPVTITAKITVDGTEYTATAAVTVKAAGSVVYVTGVTIGGDAAISLAEGDTTTLTATVAGTDGNDPADTGVAWSTSDADVATVDSDGVVTAVGAGTATITATSNGDKADGSKATASVAVTVTAKPKVWVAYDELKTAMGDLSAYTVSSGNPSSCSWITTDNYGGSDSATYAIKGNTKTKPSVIKLNSDGKSVTFTPDMDGTLTLVLGGTQYAESIAISNATGSPFTGQEGCQEITFPVTSGTEYKIEGKANIFIHAAVLRPTGTPACAHASYGAAKELTAATCGDNQTTIKWCADPICFHAEVEEVANSATGQHAAYEWKTVTAATDDADGTRAYVCKVCGAAGTAPEGESTVIPKLSHTATVSATNGTVTLSGEGVTDNGDGTYKIKNGSTVTVATTPAEGYEDGAVAVDGTVLEGATFTMPAKDVTVVAAFTAKVPVITLSKSTVDVKESATTTVTVTVVNGNVADVTAVSDSATTATATISNGTITITGVAKGTTTVTVALAGAQTKTINVNVKAADEHAHEYEVDTTASVASTCSTKGKTVEKCVSTDGLTCDEPTKETELELDPTNHEGPLVADDESAEAPTCVDAGKEADTVCDACGAVTQTGATIPATGKHTFEKDGEVLEECDVCGTPNPDIPAVTGDYTFYAPTDLKESDITGSIAWGVDKATIKDGTTYGEFFTIKGDGTMCRSWSTDHYGSIETVKKMGSYVTFTIPEGKTATLVVEASSNGSADTNVSDVRLTKGTVTGTAVAEKGGATTVAKNDMTALTYENLEAGQYFFGSPADGANTGRGVRIQSLSVTFDSEGDEPNPPADKKTVTFAVGDGTQVTEIKVDGEAANLVAGKLTDIAKDAVVTFKAAVTDATKTLKVTGATFANGVYTVTADTVTTTAVAADDPGPGPDDPGPDDPTAPTQGVFTLDMGEMVAAGKLEADKEFEAAEPATQVPELGSDGLFTIITKFSGGSKVEAKNSNTSFEDGYEAPYCFKSGGNAKVMSKLESEGKAIKFTTGAKSTVKIWWASGSGSGSSIAMANRAGDEEPVQFYADAEKSAQNAGVITIIENVPAGTNYIYSPDGTARIYKIVVAVGDSTLPGPDQPGPGPDDPGPGPDDPGTDPADVTALNDAIKAADKLAGAYTVRPDTTVVSNVNSGSKYVLQKDKDALDAAIAAAKAVAAKTDATQDEVDAAVADLAAAMDAFNAAVKTGTKTGSASSSGGGSSVRGDRGESPVTSSTTVTTADGLKVTIDKSADGGVSITAVNADGEVVAKVALPATIPSVGYKFVDVPDEHWAAKAINDMAGLGMVKGVDEANHIFDMNSNVTRGAVATIIYRMANGKSGMDNIFADVAADVWYTDGIAWANKAGVVNGFEDGTFRPDGNITREQLAVMIARFAKIIGLDTSNTGSLINFKDSTKVQAWAVDGVSWCVANGIINGRGDGTIDPAANATRAEAAAMLDRFIQLLK